MFGFFPALRHGSELMKEFAVRNSISSCQEKMHHVFCSNSDIPLICHGDSLNTLTDFLLSYAVLDYFDIKHWAYFIRTTVLTPTMKTKVSQKWGIYSDVLYKWLTVLSRNKSIGLLFFIANKPHGERSSIYVSKCIITFYIL